MDWGRILDNDFNSIENPLGRKKFPGTEMTIFPPHTPPLQIFEFEFKSRQYLRIYFITTRGIFPTALFQQL
jgi:hypothetical protein